MTKPNMKKKGVNISSSTPHATKKLKENYISNAQTQGRCETP
jgi:hypothetical protein